jgi:hypothetical protein
MTSVILLSNNNVNVDLIENLITSLRQYDYIPDEIDISLSLLLNTTDGTQIAQGVFTYNNGSPVSLTKTININYESAIITDNTFTTHLMAIYNMYPTNIPLINVTYNGTAYTCNKSISINRKTFYILDPVV